MKNEHNITTLPSEQELIRKYIANTLTKEEDLAVAALYDTDEDFKDALDGLENLTLEEFDELMNRLEKNIEKKIAIPSNESGQTEMITESAKIKQLFPYRRMAIAASVILFLSFGSYVLFTTMQSTSTKLYTQHFEFADYPDMITRGSGEELSNSEKLAISAYNAENYEISIEHFEVLKDKYPDNVKYGLFLGISYLGNNKPELAIETFKGMKYQGTEFCNDVNWYLGLAYLRIRDKAAAREIFTKLADKNCYYHAAASDILAKL
jgi:tetratricopeptide (TPR) repeat protein